MAKPGTRSGAAEVVSDATRDVKAERVKAEAEDRKAKAEAYIAKAVADQAKPKAEKLLADSESAGAYGEKVKAIRRRLRLVRQLLAAQAFPASVQVRKRQPRPPVRSTTDFWWQWAGGVLQL